MDYDVLFVGIPVSDFEAGQAWYERFFGRPPDVVAHAEEVLWRVTGSGWLYLKRDQQRAGNCSVAIAVPSIDQARTELEARGVGLEATEALGNEGWKAIALDPDANAIALIQVVPNA